MATTRTVRVTAVLVLALAGCGSGITPAQQIELSAYTADQLQCVALATSRDAGEACIDGVKRTWCGAGGLLQEAGACHYDGGTP